MTCEYFSRPMNCGTRTVPNCETRPRSLRPRSTSITCSERSFSLRFSSSASLRVFLIALAARTRAGNRMRLRHPAFHAHEHLGRRPDNRHLPHPQEIHVRRRVHVTQRAIHRERIGGDLRFESLRQHDLIDVAGRDVLLRGLHHLEKPLARHVRCHLDAACPAGGCGCERSRRSSRSRKSIFVHAN